MSKPVRGSFRPVERPESTTWTRRPARTSRRGETRRGIARLACALLLAFAVLAAPGLGSDSGSGGITIEPLATWTS
jgi:hypothetical protein